MSRWYTTTFGEISSRITKGTTPPGGKGFVENGINYIKSESLSYDGKIDCSKFVYINKDTHEKLKRSQLEVDDILFSMAGAFLGKTGLVTCSMLPANTNQAVAIIRLKQDVVMPQFASFFLRQNTVIEYINNMSGQSAQPNINFQEIASIEIQLPTFNEQRVITAVLSSLDDKIDLLYRQNKTLEAIAETLFRQSFIEEADECWEEGTIADLIEFNPERRLTKGTLAQYLDMAGLSTSTFMPSGWYERDYTSGMKFMNGDTLLARITPCLENGKTAFITFLKDNEVAWGSTEYIVMRPKEPIHPFFAYTLARTRDFRDYAEGCLEGSSGRQRVIVNHLQKYSFFIPDKNAIRNFTDHANSIVPKLRKNAIKIHTLEKIRDTLLPKLMSGEVRVDV